ncbi:MAG: TspO/MBR family protein [Hyphomicrobiaceae bacterium]
MSDLIPLGTFIAATTAAAATGSQFAPGSWYAQLQKPSWTPPPWAFPVVWSILYIMIAFAGWKAWQAQGFGPLVILWIVQLVLNALWSWIMFGRNQIGWALADVSALWLTIAAFIITAWPVSQTASLLFVPYLAWVTIAWTLNLRVYQLNPA